MNTLLQDVDVDAPHPESLTELHAADLRGRNIWVRERGLVLQCKGFSHDCDVLIQVGSTRLSPKPVYVVLQFKGGVQELELHRPFHKL